MDNIDGILADDPDEAGDVSDALRERVLADRERNILRGSCERQCIRNDDCRMTGTRLLVDQGDCVRLRPSDFKLRKDVKDLHRAWWVGVKLGTNRWNIKRTEPRRSHDSRFARAINAESEDALLAFCFEMSVGIH